MLRCCGVAVLQIRIARATPKLCAELHTDYHVGFDSVHFGQSESEHTTRRLEEAWRSIIYRLFVRPPS